MVWMDVFVADLDDLNDLMFNADYSSFLLSIYLTRSMLLALSFLLHLLKICFPHHAPSAFLT